MSATGPTDARDWLRSMKVDFLLQSFVTDVLRDRPEDVPQYLRKWCAVHASPEHASPADEDGDEGKALSSEGNGAASSAATESTASGSVGPDSDRGEQPVDEERPDQVELRMMFPHPAASGVVPRSLDRIGEGNYGYVLRSAAICEVHDGAASTSEEAARSPPSFAIKVVPIRAHWTLDEAKQTELISRTAERVLAENPSATLPCTHNACTTDNEVPTTGAQDHSCGHCARRGAASTLRLQGPVCYDPDTDALWLPLTWAPVTLEQCIRFRCAERDMHDGACVSKPRPLFSIHELRHAAVQMLLVLHFMTSCCNVVHLDVKPANILLERQWRSCSSSRGEKRASRSTDSDMVVCKECNGDGCDLPQLFLGDMGLVQPIGADKTQLGDFMYMAPEIYWDGPSTDADVVDVPPSITTKRAPSFHPTHDVWSLGCTLLHMMEGEEPFTWEGKDRFAALEDNYLCPAPRHTMDWPAELLHFLLCCFERDYDKRPTPHQLLAHPFARPVTS